MVSFNAQEREMKKIRVIVQILVLLCCLSGLNAQQIKSAEGHGATETEARADAMASLSYYFSSNVKSSVGSSSITTTDSKKSSSIEKKTLVTTEFPLYGVTFEVTGAGKNSLGKTEYTVKASMDPKVVLPLYEKELQNCSDSIESKLRSLKTLSGTKKEQAYTALAAEYAQFQKLEMVVELLGTISVPKLSLSPEDFSTEYAKFVRDVTSLEKAAQMIAEGIPKSFSGIYVYQPKYEGDGTSTQFSRTVSQFLQSKLGSRLAVDREHASYYLQGTYYMVPGTVDADDMMLNYYLFKKDNSVAASAPLLRIPYEVYGNYKYLPAGYSLTQEIERGNVVDPSFGISLRINGDKNPQSFKKGDSLIIEARATSPCYIYVIGHVFNERNEQFSYLFPLNPYGDGKEMFVKRITPQDQNRWVVLNPVIEDEVVNLEIIPPYGEETLQIFAVTVNDLDSVTALIPDYRETDDYYIVRGSPTSVVSKTRGLNVKAKSTSASKVVHKAEASISYETHF